MVSKEKTIFVYDDFSMQNPTWMGTLYVNSLKGEESYSFEYDREWLKKTSLKITLDPELMPYSGRQYPFGKTIFGLFSDSSPDRWGRVLMNKRERILAGKEGRKPAKLYDSDYLLGVYDETRLGGIRFKTEPNGAFLSADKKTAAPPWASLRTLEEASRNFENEDIALSEKWLNQLIRPGSSLGGARPKATVIDPKEQLWIAKFPSRNDENDSGAWEMVTHDLAEICGLHVPEAKLEKFSKLGSTYLVKRFDRILNKRVHFASAMTLLGKTDGASVAEGTSYLDIAAFIKSYGAQPKRDLIELWKRIVFNMAVSNTDDHLRNHAFIFTENGWRLSPLYDVNPVPYGDELSLNVDEADNSINIDLAIETAVRFGLSRTDATNDAKDILVIVRENWEKLATAYGLSRRLIEEMRPAFRACYG
ncbi:MAG: type II toxin-antitoxin system HipA family toxin [Oribacterium parvum]|uniref:type II toxin-antitoxin system HipA family toxin n=1 Tax=Oribacterium parvum TaxID=1501329 RepID=UPI001CB463BD|nr:type II toxin-antitoxin system HipA family toxin [Oribacterium parvum]MBF1269242.1 type II toxin-antitoxin system HipA family toxin [Oribacterium parvum]